ncbi:MAG: 3-methyl-2-oxobutanoate hydroxymethyltransferase [Deinococcaceae bacterium]
MLSSPSAFPKQGHLGLTPQTATALGGFKVQGRDAHSAQTILDEARHLVSAGVFALVLEAIPSGLAQRVTEALSVPTIGIGAGPSCDGQVLVYHDVLGMFDRFKPKFVRTYAEVGQQSIEALKQYANEVRNKIFPDKEHSFEISDEILQRLY